MRRGLAAVAVVLSWAAAASAHLNMLRPRLIEIVEQSDVSVIASIEPSQNSTTETSARVTKVLFGSPNGSTIRFRGPARLRPGGSFLLFARQAEPLALVTKAGEVFEVNAGDASLMDKVVKGLRAAGKSGGNERMRLQEKALIPALAAHSIEMRYHAALELDRLAGAAQLTPAEQEQLRRAAAADPVIEPIVAKLLGAAAKLAENNPVGAQE